jgi:hypothetical protein
MYINPLDIDYLGKLEGKAVPALLDGGYQEYFDTIDHGWHNLTRRLSTGHASTRSRHYEGRSTTRAALPISAMTVITAAPHHLDPANPIPPIFSKK